MNSVYFPAHVVVIIKRLVNVVSTLSISNQYLLHQQTLAKPDESQSSHNLNCIEHPFDCLKNVEWPWWAVRRNWDMGLCRIDNRHEIRDSGILLNCESTEIIQKYYRVLLSPIFLATIRLPNWLPNPDNWAWPRLLSFVQLEVNHAQSETDPPPPSPLEPPERPQGENHDKKHQKSAPQDRVELPRKEAKVKPPDIIHQLLVNPALYDPLLVPRYPIVLCHGLFSTCYFLNINQILNNNNRSLWF